MDYLVLNLYATLHAVTTPIQAKQLVTRRLVNAKHKDAEINSSISKTLFIIPTDAHYYKIIEMLKQFYKIIKLAPTCFGSRRNHHQGTVLCLAKTTNYGFSVLVGIDAVNVMHNRLICRHNIDRVYTDEHRKKRICSFS